MGCLCAKHDVVDGHAKHENRVSVWKPSIPGQKPLFSKTEDDVMMYRPTYAFYHRQMSVQDDAIAMPTVVRL